MALLTWLFSVHIVEGSKLKIVMLILWWTLIDQLELNLLTWRNEIEKLLKTKVDLVSRNGVRHQYFEQIEQDLNYV